MDEHQCKFEDKIIEMHGDIKALVVEFRAMNGSLKNTKEITDNHVLESRPYRKKVDEIWAGIHFCKWIIALIFGTGLIFQALKLIK
jgi:hypothetical protein